MVLFYPPPDSRRLLPPLLASLPTSFVSPRPPPSLLPLLEPILRQRVQHLTATSSSPSDSWLPLLCWQATPAQNLVKLVKDSDAFELHPVSGEIDFGDIEEIKYRRLDEETLQARIVVSELGIAVTYLWCDADSEGGDNGWRVSEVTPLEGESSISVSNWAPSVAEADDESTMRALRAALTQGQDSPTAQGSSSGSGSDPPSDEEDEPEDDGDYWARYDRTPATTPSTKPSEQKHHTNGTTSEEDYFGRYNKTPPTTPLPSATAKRTEYRSKSEGDYFNQYADVQPQLDNDDPSADRKIIGASTLTGNTVASSVTLHFTESSTSSSSTTKAASPKLDPALGSENVLSRHISTSIRGLFDLSKSSGMVKADFVQLVQLELDLLDLDTELA